VRTLDHYWLIRAWRTKKVSKGRSTLRRPTIDLCSVSCGSDTAGRRGRAFHNQKLSSKHDPALPLYTLRKPKTAWACFSLCLREIKQLNQELSLPLVHAGPYSLARAWLSCFSSEWQYAQFLFTQKLSVCVRRQNKESTIEQRRVMDASYRVCASVDGRTSFIGGIASADCRGTLDAITAQLAEVFMWASGPARTTRPGAVGCKGTAVTRVSRLTKKFARAAILMKKQHTQHEPRIWPAWTKRKESSWLSLFDFTEGHS